MFIASCTDSLQIILEHFNGTQCIYDKYFDSIYISRGNFSFTNDKSNKRSNGFFNNRAKKMLYLCIYKTPYKNYGVLCAYVTLFIVILNIILTFNVINTFHA